ncbi:MAG TPA: hypothetical protein VNX28_18810 [Gemmataceae bacterium]|jgi:hypothetical protein|nr:hypothetical protein [Gemmataceae bacterium]
MARISTLLAGLGCLLLASTATAAELATGNPKVQSIESISFGPDGLLLIGDGKGSQVIAVQTGDIKPVPWGKLDMTDLKGKVGGMLGTSDKGIEILKLTVNPTSHRAYLAVRKLDGKQDLILTVDGQGKIQEYALDNVKYSRYKLPPDEKTATKITDITFADGRILLAVQAGQQFSSKIFSIDTRQDDATPYWISTETFHVAHGKWETNAPIRTVIPYMENGKKYLVGAFTCTPIVKYSLEDLKAGGRVQGQSVIELGHGNTPQDMFVYEKNGKSYILMNNVRMGGMQKNNPVGPSPYWTAKVDYTILGETEKINDKALWRFNPKSGKASVSETERALVVPEYHGVVMMDRLDADRAIVIRTDDKGGFSLAVLPLP